MRPELSDAHDIAEGGHGPDDHAETWAACVSGMVAAICTTRTNIIVVSVAESVPGTIAMDSGFLAAYNAGRDGFDLAQVDRCPLRDQPSLLLAVVVDASTIRCRSR